jgi:hypothetical protein
VKRICEEQEKGKGERKEKRVLEEEESGRGKVR